MTKTMANTERKGTYCSDCGFWNRPERKNCQNCGYSLPKGFEPRDIIALAALVIAVSSIILGAWEAESTVHVNIKPLLDTECTNYIDNKALNLINYGMGPAVLTKVKFYKYDSNSSSIGDFINLPYGATSHVYTFAENFSYIQKGQEITLANITSDYFERQKNYNDTQIDKIMKVWTENITGINVEIAYEDALGWKQETLERTLNFG